MRTGVRFWIYCIYYERVIYRDLQISVELAISVNSKNGRLLMVMTCYMLWLLLVLSDIRSLCAHSLTVIEMSYFFAPLFYREVWTELLRSGSQILRQSCTLRIFLCLWPQTFLPCRSRLAYFSLLRCSSRMWCQVLESFHHNPCRFTCLIQTIAFNRLFILGIERHSIDSRCLLRWRQP